MDHNGEFYYLVHFVDSKQYVADLKKSDSEKELSYDTDEYNEWEHAMFFSLSIPRNQLLPLHSFVDMPRQNAKNINSDVLRNYENFHEQGAPKNLQLFLQSEIHKLVPQTFLNNFETGELVTVLIDFMKVNNKNEFIVSVYAGEIGIVMDSQNDQIKQYNGEIASGKIRLKNHEVMVYFPKIPLIDLFPILNDSYQELGPFDEEQCIVFNKAYLVSLSANKPQ